MLTLWYIILGWKEYNKPFKNKVSSAKSVDATKKPDLIAFKKDAKSIKPTDVNKPDPPKPIAVNPKPPILLPRGASDSTPLSNSPSEISKIPELPKVPSKNSESIKADFTKFAPEIPKAPGLPEPVLKTQEPPKSPNPPKRLQEPFDPMPTRTPDSSMPDFASSGSPAYVPPGSDANFPLPPFVPGAPGAQKLLPKENELFGIGNKFSNSTFDPYFDKSSGNLRGLSYSKGELLDDDQKEARKSFEVKPEENFARIPKYMEESVISNPDSLESDEDDDLNYEKNQRL